MKELREGYTTGTCAAAGAKAAVLALLNKENHDKVSVKLVMGGYLEIPVKNIEILSENIARVTIEKDAGDDPDITHGKDIVVTAMISNNANKITDVTLTAGKGVGKVTKPGLPVPPGEPAINPGPRKMIIENLQEFFEENREFFIEISVPEGEELAKKTLNPHLGIIGGISILGTTGIVKPMSEEAFKDSLVPQIKTTKALGYKAIVLTPGNIGMDSAVKYGIPRDAIVITSNFIGYMLEHALDNGFENIILWGHIGKIVKVAGGNFYTHNRISDSRMEILAAHLARHNAPSKLINTVMNEITTEGAWKIIEENGYGKIWEDIAEKASERSERYLFSQASVGIVLLKDRENILYINNKAGKIGEFAGWNISQ
jgi:cobalt-precorrin-5B (C1)-methyltransferase